MRNRTKNVLLALSIVLASILITTNASAYVFINESRCPNGATWSSANQPQSYYLNENGSADVGFDTLKSVIQTSWDAWGEPCCSSFSASYQGTTTQTATSTSGNTVLSWEENSWPTQLGNVNSTIGVTLSSIYNNCEIAQAPIAFNGVGFTFTTNGGGTDLQSIATHEIGHNLGLGHSRATGATMYASYSGGTGTRSLEQDDVDGVCALYTTSCSCTNDSDCAANEVCTSNGSCEIPPCTSDDDCPSTETCNTSTGACEVPPCSSDSDCGDGYYCDTNNSTCRPDCPVCEACTQSSDCGSNGFCVDFGNNNNKCIVTCGESGTCPGDSECFGVEQSGQTYYLCLNPDANSSGACPDSYTCSSDSTGDGGSDGTCEGLGNSCTESNNNCTQDNDICLQPTSGDPFCSCICNDDSDCGSGNQCVQLQDGSKGCIPGDSTTDPCADVSCPSGQVCSDGQCVDDGTGGDTGGTTDTGGSTDSDTGGSTDDTGTSDDEDGGETLDGGMRLPDSGMSEEERNESGSESGVCSAVGGSDSVPASLLAVLIGFGVVAVRRRHRK
ncbi:MAG: matrixin family metalloprotease [Myxococcota bacterium]